MRNALLMLASAGLLAGCSLTLAVRGQVGNTGETFTGTATGYMDGAGDLTITSNRGAVCTGAFVYVTRRQGSGTFTCNDGRTGPFEFVSTGSRGTGSGRLGDQPITFVFG
jgi:hypothetical protein